MLIYLLNTVVKLPSWTKQGDPPLKVGNQTDRSQSILREDLFEKDQNVVHVTQETMGQGSISEGAHRIELSCGGICRHQDVSSTHRNIQNLNVYNHVNVYISVYMHTSSLYYIDIYVYKQMFILRCFSTPRFVERPKLRQGAEGNSMFILSLGLAQAGWVPLKPWGVAPNHPLKKGLSDCPFIDGLSIINHPFDPFVHRIVHEINHPAIGDPPFMEPPDRNGQ